MKTIKLRIKDKHSKLLGELAAEVNYVWNYVNALSYEHTRKTGKFFSAYDIDKYTSGSSHFLQIHSQTIQAIASEYTIRRKQFNKNKLKWRVSNIKSSKRSLGWIPFKKKSIRCGNDFVKYGKMAFSVWDSYGLDQYKDQIRMGSFVEDAKGHWYVCLAIKTEEQETQNIKEIGIDFGLKSLASCSDGQVIYNPSHYRNNQKRLGKAQRANKKKQVRAIHAKIKNSRKDFLHKESTKLVKENGLIVVGDLNAKALVKTKMAKSVLDTSFSAFRTMLRYKCQQAGVMFIEVNEKFTTQVCSCCGDISSSSPKGRTDLRIREWTCVSCGTSHDRDVNAAKNILRLGHQSLAEGVS